MNRLQIGQTIKAAGVTIIPIEQIITARETRSHMFWWQGSKEIHALVIMSPAGIYALDTNARELDVNELISSFPKLAEALNLETDPR